VLRSTSSSLLWRGLLAVVIGVVSVAWPNITVGAFVILFAVFAFLTAVADRAGPVAGYLLLAMVSAAAGVVALVWPDITALALTIWVAAWALVTGVLEVALAFRSGEPAGERSSRVTGWTETVTVWRSRMPPRRLRRYGAAVPPPPTRERCERPGRAGPVGGRPQGAERRPALRARAAALAAAGRGARRCVAGGSRPRVDGRCAARRARSAATGGGVPRIDGSGNRGAVGAALRRCDGDLADPAGDVQPRAHAQPRPSTDTDATSADLQRGHARPTASARSGPGPGRRRRTAPGRDGHAAGRRLPGHHRRHAGALAPRQPPCPRPVALGRHFRPPR
jgi:Short repeat of unknown function (DUF308)